MPPLILFNDAPFGRFGFGLVRGPIATTYPGSAFSACEVLST